jgi:hypothetical protein
LKEVTHRSDTTDVAVRSLECTKEIARLSGKFYRDGFAVSDIRIVTVHLRQSHDFLEQSAGRVVSVMVS